MNISENKTLANNNSSTVLTHPVVRLVHKPAWHCHNLQGESEQLKTHEKNIKL